MGERIVLKEELRQQLFANVKNIAEFRNWNEVADYFGTPYSSFKKYKSGRLTIPQSIFENALGLLEEEQREKFITQAIALEPNWGAIKGGKRGIVALREKYGMKQFREWRRETAKISPILGASRSIKIPLEISTELAELVGAYLGDGTLTKYFIRIFGSKKFDGDYLLHLSNIIEKNFGIKPKIRFLNNKNLAILEISSKKLVDFLRNKFGLIPGDKIANRAEIPQRIIENQELVKACLRGLMDTDGSFCRRDTYMCLAFTSHNHRLLNQVFELGKKMGYFSYKGKQQTGTNSWKRVQKYFSEVGSSNLRHIIRFSERLQNNQFLYQKETLKYFPKYQNSILPYYGPVV